MVNDWLLKTGSTPASNAPTGDWRLATAFFDMQASKQPVATRLDYHIQWGKINPLKVLFTQVLQAADLVVFSASPFGIKSGHSSFNFKGFSQRTT